MKNKKKWINKTRGAKWMEELVKRGICDLFMHVQAVSINIGNDMKHVSAMKKGLSLKESPFSLLNSLTL